MRARNIGALMSRCLSGVCLHHSIILYWLSGKTPGGRKKEIVCSNFAQLTALRNFFVQKFNSFLFGATKNHEGRW